MKLRLTLCTAVALSLAGSLIAGRADTIELKDGRKISGTMSRQGDQAVIKGDDGSSTSAAFADVLHVTLTNGDSPADASKSEWTRIAAQIKTAPDLSAIISLHQKFLEKFPDSSQAQNVKSSLGVYQQLADAKAVKFHGRWMPPDQIDVTIKQWTEAAARALAFYKAGNYKETLNAAKAILAKDDQNPDALTLADLAADQTKNYGVARKYFTSLADADPTSGLAQNNLAVVSAQQMQISESLTHFIKALQLIANNRVLLDNITEAINAYKKSGADQNALIFRNLVAAYSIAESAMEAQMAKPANGGLHRFGSTWATKEEMAAAAKNVQTIRAQMAQLELQYKANQDGMTALDARIKQASADVDAAAGRYQLLYAQFQMSRPEINGDPNNYQYQGQLAEENYNAAKDRRDVLQAQKNVLLNHQKDYLTQADTLKAQLAAATNPFTGELHLIELPGSTDPPATAPSAAPATAPAK